MISSKNKKIPSSSLLLLELLFLPSILVCATAVIEEKEKHALLDLKQSFVANPGGVWSTDDDNCCNWDGVECDDRTGHVISLDLCCGVKIYRLPPSLVELKHLTSLELGDNEFKMRIPEFIGSLSKLTYLDLSDAGFSGKIPPHLGNLSRLRTLSLGGSNSLFSDNLQWLSHLSSLTYLDLINVNLSSATDWLSTLKRLPSLSSLACLSCSLPPLPLSSISPFNSSTSLQTLDLSNNNISSSIFSCLINSTNKLKVLHLANLNFEENFPEILGAALIGRSRYSLEELYLSGNNLTKLPWQVMMLPSLTKLDASSNRISGNLQEILWNLPENLKFLNLSANSLNGVISDAHFSKSTKLKILVFSYNNLLTFNFSESWAPPFQLVHLELASCKLGPAFPNWLLTQKQLQFLDISDSSISGAIPNAFWNFSTSLMYLNVSFNNIHSTVPNSSSSLAYATIDLSSNAFHGAIPLFLFNATWLDLSNNRFSSFLPFQHRVLRRQLIINLSNNSLAGLLPNWFFHVDGLRVLNLEDNMLSGTLPKAIGSLWELNTLHLSNNRFSGQLPLSMKNCSHLRILELANNRFSEGVPVWLGKSLAQLVILSLRSNHFSGELPSNLCHLQSLQVLDLSGNRISGYIPGCVHNFSSMATNEGLKLGSLIATKNHLSYAIRNDIFEILDHASILWKGVLAQEYTRNLQQRNVIDLSSNCLTGEIPIGVTTLLGLRSLNLSRNYLDGSIPDKIGELKSLEVLVLSSNRLSGEIPGSLASLTFLDDLNLSNNNLSGRIPTSTQLQTFDPSSYDGNPNLCGKPLPTKCPGDEEGEKQPAVDEAHHEENDASFDMQAFFAALGTGFAFGFLGVLGISFFK